MAHFDVKGVALKADGTPYSRILGGIPRTTVEDRKALLKNLEDTVDTTGYYQAIDDFVAKMKANNFSFDQVILSFDIIATKMRQDRPAVVPAEEYQRLLAELTVLRGLMPVQPPPAQADENGK